MPAPVAPPPEAPEAAPAPVAAPAPAPTVQLDPSAPGMLRGNAPAILSNAMSQAMAHQSAVNSEAAAAAAPPVSPTAGLSGEYVKMIGPDGELHEFPKENVGKATELGYKQETALDVAKREYLAENKGLKGATKAFIYELGNQGTFGVTGAIAEHTGDDFDRAKTGWLLADHRVAQVAGGALGFGASLAYGGEFFKAAQGAGKLAEGAVLGTELAEKALAGKLAAELVGEGATAAAAKAAAPSLARKMLASGVGMGVEGAALTAPKAITEAALGDPENAAESLMYGFGAGAILGAGGAVVKGGVGKIAEHIESQGGLREMAGRKAEERAWNSLASNQASLKKGAKIAETIPGGTEGVGRMLLDEGLIRKPGQDVLEHAEAIAARKSQVGGEIGALWQKADELAPGSGLDTAKFLGRVEKEIIAPLSKTPGMEPLARQVQEYSNSFLEHASSEGDTLSFTKAHEYRQALDDLVFRTEKAAQGTKTAELRSVRQFLREDMEESLAAVSKDVGKDLLGELKETNLLYRQLKAADAAAMDYATVRAPTNRGLSLTDYGAAGMGAIAGGHLGAIGAIGSAIGHNLVRTEGSGIAARALDAFSKNGILTAEQAMGRVGAELDRIPEALKGTVDAAKRAPSRAMLELIGEAEGSGSKRDQFDKVSTKITDMASNPEKMTSAIADIAGKISGGGAPTVADAYTQKMTQVMQHLQTQLPKPLTPDSPLNSIKWKPTDRQMSEFEKRVAVVMNPFSVFDRLNDKTLTGAEVDSLKTVWPKLYDAMIGRISSYVNDPVKATPMDFTQRLKLTLLTGHDFNVNVNPDSINGLQSTYKQADQTQGPQMSKPVKTASLETDAQRIQAR